jgi:hypothetical protein
MLSTGITGQVRSTTMLDDGAVMLSTGIKKGGALFGGPARTSECVPLRDGPAATERPRRR